MDRGSGLHTKAATWLEDVIIAPDGGVVLTSPYLTVEICKQLGAAALGSEFSWQVITCLDPSAVANGYLSVRGLRILMDSGIQIHDVPRVHAKAFLVGNRGLLGSANLTGAGLGSSAVPNFELSIELDSDQVAQAKQIIDSWPARSVGYEDLEDLLKRAERLTSAARPEGQEFNADSALQIAEQLLVDARDPQRGLWLKLEYGQPALEEWRQESYFASPKKGRPGFRPGDLVFICAQDTHDCYAVLEVIGEPEDQPSSYVSEVDAASAERWPWVNKTKPRLVPDELMPLKLSELDVSGQGLQNGHVRLTFDQFTAGVRSLARLATQ